MNSGETRARRQPASGQAGFARGQALILAAAQAAERTKGSRVGCVGVDEKQQIVATQMSVSGRDIFGRSAPS